MEIKRFSKWPTSGVPEVLSSSAGVIRREAFLLSLEEDKMTSLGDLGLISSDGESNGRGIDRRDLLFVGGASVALGLDTAVGTKTQASTVAAVARIDAHTHFAPLKFLEFA